MPSLKDIKTQINSVGSTKKITSAMKMVAASKLRRSQEKAESARPYSSRLEEMLSSLASSSVKGDGIIKLLTGTGKDNQYLIVSVNADRISLFFACSSLSLNTILISSKIIIDGLPIIDFRCSKYIKVASLL